MTERDHPRGGIAPALLLLGALTWLPARWGVMTTWDAEWLGLGYTSWNRLTLIPLALLAAGSAAALVPDWRSRLPEQLDALVVAWRAPSAREGMAVAGGVEMPAPMMAVVALDELVVHGWDLAVATGQRYSVSDVDAETCTTFAGSVGESAEERAGLYGPRVPVPAAAPPFDRLLGLTGRDPGWRP